jgi:hypothetical protein
MKMTGSQIEKKQAMSTNNPSSQSSADKNNAQAVFNDVLEDTQGENLESQVITESGNIGEGIPSNIGPGGDTRLAIMEDGEELTKGKVFGKGVIIEDNENEP